MISINQIVLLSQQLKKEKNLDNQAATNEAFKKLDIKDQDGEILEAVLKQLNKNEEAAQEEEAENMNENQVDSEG